MGSTFALDLAGNVDQGTLELGIALRTHLQHNHYPPIPTVFVDTCIEAISLANEDDWDGWVELPEGVTDAQTGLTSSSPRKLIEWAHLDFFLNPQEDF